MSFVGSLVEHQHTLVINPQQIQQVRVMWLGFVQLCWGKGIYLTQCNFFFLHKESHLDVVVVGLYPVFVIGKV